MVNYILARGSPLMQGLLNQNKSDGYICLMHSGVKNKSLQSEQVTKYKKTKLRRLFVSWKSNKPCWVSSARLRKKLKTLICLLNYAKRVPQIMLAGPRALQAFVPLSDGKPKTPSGRARLSVINSRAKADSRFEEYKTKERKRKRTKRRKKKSANILQKIRRYSSWVKLSSRGQSANHLFPKGGVDCYHKNLILMAREGLENPRGRQLMLNLPVICSKCYLIQYQNSHYALFSWPLVLLFFSPYLFYPVLSAQRINHRFTIFFHCGTKKTIAKNASSGLKFRRRACGKNLFAPLFQCPPKPKSNNWVDIYF